MKDAPAEHVVGPELDPPPELLELEELELLELELLELELLELPDEPLELELLELPAFASEPASLAPELDPLLLEELELPALASRPASLGAVPLDPALDEPELEPLLLAAGCPPLLPLCCPLLLPNPPSSVASFAAEQWATASPAAKPKKERCSIRRIIQELPIVADRFPLGGSEHSHCSRTVRLINARLLRLRSHRFG